MATGVSATTRAADALLVVEARRRHVAEHHRRQGADVDTRLHRGRDAEQVDAVGRRDLGVLPRAEEDALEPRLPCLGVDAVGLAGEFLAVEAEAPGVP